MPALHLSSPSGQNFVVEFPGIDRATIPYLHHFVTFCSRFIAYPNDSEMNPFQEELVPLAVASPALLNSMAALAAAHLSRSQKHHDIPAARYYSRALRELNSTLSDPQLARSDSALASCLILCVYEVALTLTPYLFCIYEANPDRFAIPEIPYGSSISKAQEI